MKNNDFSSKVFDSFNFLFMAAVFITMLYPFIHALSYSLSKSELLTGGIMLFPKGLDFTSYLLSFKQADVLHGFFISVARTVIGPLSMILVTSMAAYVISKDDFIGVKFFRKYFVFTLYFSGGIIPTYILIKSLSLTNNFLVYIVPLLISAFNLILVKTYIESLPKELEECAHIDGANHFTLFFKIIFPLCLPITAAIGLFDAINHWNALTDTVLYNSMNRNLYTLQFVLYNLLFDTTQSVQEARSNYTAHPVTAETLKMSLTVISILPIFVLFPLAQKYFISGLMVGSIKG